ncbi:hypothetical protein CQ012_06435 [Arthrobacter sp. MYb214]|uniref:DUF4411 family protein n=1 Tax=Arthrobacter sp. MYb214 TaxID=1848596 RepID=UPI000CFB488A|nr:DUF4411 family protein [Arthrobacter sp. MYb214]PRB76645.1 hypothetical protein CQ012_06435 [Arthrobacter sp. MYb214]
MTQIYVLDSSALQTLNKLAPLDATLTEKLTDLRDKSRVIYCEATKNERQEYAKGEPVTIWAAAGWRSLKEAAEVRYQSVHSVCAKFGLNPAQQHILDINNEETDQQQAIVTIALAQQLATSYEVIVVSDEEWTIEDRCTVSEACIFLGIACCTVKDFLEAEAITLVTEVP